MKPPRILFVASLAINVLFVAALAWRPAASRAFFRDALGVQPSPPPGVRPAAAAMTPSPPPSDPAALADAALRAIDWASLQPGDFNLIRARLAALGFPPDTVRSMTGVLILKHYAERRQALHRAGNPMEYWRNPHRRPDASTLTQSRELEREGKRVLREVLGGDFDFDDDPNSERRRYGALSSDKIAQLKKIFADYSDLEEQMFNDGADRGSAASRARSALLAKEKRADIERLLTPEELLDYDLRNSQGAHRLRNKIGAFEATEAEFLALYPAFKAAADAEPPPGAISRTNMAEVRRAREMTERQLEADLRRVLGENRYAQWQEANDHMLQETRALIASLNLPPHVAGEVVALQREIQPRLSEIERSHDLTPNERDAQLGALGNDARNRLTRLLGPAGFEAYKRRGGGWLGMALNRSSPAP